MGGRLRRALSSALWDVRKRQGAVPRWPLVALLIWPLLVAPGFVVVERHANTPGRLAEPPATWPSGLALERATDRHTVVMLAHPRCPCTRASLSELAVLMADIEHHSDAIVLFVDPVGNGWEQTDIWRQAEGIPGVRVVTDHGGAVANQLGAYTSGQMLLYDPAGRLVFNGGITRSRGHEGDNPGRLAITDIVHGDGAALASSNVFGCDLQEPERAK